MLTRTDAKTHRDIMHSWQWIDSVIDRLSEISSNQSL